MYEYKSKLVRVVDGDTLDAMVDLGFNVWIKVRVRLAGIDAFENRTRDKEEKKKGIAAKERLIEVLKSSNNEFSLKSYGVGKFGRCIGELFVTKNYIRSPKYHGKCINTMLVKEGHAVPYED
jgi:micrococcal nuclease